MSSCPKCSGPMTNIAFMGPEQLVCSDKENCVEQAPVRNFCAETMEACREKPGQFLSVRQTDRYSEPSPCGQGWVMPTVGQTPTPSKSAQPGLQSGIAIKMAADDAIRDEFITAAARMTATGAMTMDEYTKLCDDYPRN